jgi:hypothetical protein
LANAGLANRAKRRLKKKSGDSSVYFIKKIIKMKWLNI